MLAKFEKRAYAGNEHVWVGKYRNLHNISHWHMEHELIACREGSAQVMLDDTMFNITQQQCIFCHSGCVHYISASPDSLLLVCLFNEKMYDPITSPFTLENPVFEDRYGILPKLSEIRHELQNQPIFFECRTEAMIGEILVDVFRGEPLRKAQWQFSDVITRYKHLDLVLENFAYLFIWNFQFINTAFGFSFLRQIPCHKQYAPKIIDAIVYFVVCQLQTDRLFNFLPSNQTLNFVPCGFIRFVNKSFYKVVAAGIDPVRLRLCIKLSAKSVNMVNHIPRTVNIGITKTISIILVFRFT